MKLTYAKFAPYYDLIFQQKQYSKEVDFLTKQIKTINPLAKSLLDVGCGTGSHLKYFEKYFSDLNGTDLNPAMIQEAKRKKIKAKFTVGGMINFKFKKKFDAITCLFAVFNYNLDLNQARQTLLNFKNHLTPNGICILGLYNRHNPQKTVSLNLGKNSQTQVAKINQYIYNPNNHLETTDFLLLMKKGKKIDFAVETNHQIRIFSLSEITQLLKTNGFGKIKIFDSQGAYPIIICQLLKS